jgi:hypothetical protein
VRVEGECDLFEMNAALDGACVRRLSIDEPSALPITWLSRTAPERQFEIPWDLDQVFPADDRQVERCDPDFAQDDKPA